MPADIMAIALASEKSSKYWKTSGYIKRRQKDQYRIRNSLYYEKKWIIVVGREDWKQAQMDFEGLKTKTYVWKNLEFTLL